MDFAAPIETLANPADVMDTDGNALGFESMRAGSPDGLSAPAEVTQVVISGAKRDRSPPIMEEAEDNYNDNDNSNNRGLVSQNQSSNFGDYATTPLRGSEIGATQVSPIKESPVKRDQSERVFKSPTAGSKASPAKNLGLSTSPKADVPMLDPVGSLSP